MELGNKYEGGGGCFAITVTEIGRTGGIGKLLYVYLANSRTNRFHRHSLFRCTIYKLLLRADRGNIVFKTIGRYLTKTWVHIFWKLEYLKNKTDIKYILWTFKVATVNHFWITKISISSKNCRFINILAVVL